MVRQIATAAEEQSATTEEISSNITGIAGIAEENSKGVKEVSDASVELHKVAEDLKGLVGTFVLAERGGARDKSGLSNASEGQGNVGELDENVLSLDNHSSVRNGSTDEPSGTEG
jgi:hypothetical protein